MTISLEAPVVWNYLKGVVCVYKPAGITVRSVRKTIVGNICRDLNQMKCRQPINHVFIEGNTQKALQVRVAPSFADNELVVGPRYQPRDVKCSWATNLGQATSGVFVLGINEGIKLAQTFHMSRPLRAYHVKGVLGKVTDNYFVDGETIEKVSFKHVKRSTIDRVLASMQAAHQKVMFEQSGVDIQSQAAYELAVQGPIRPSENNVPIVYGIRCVSFDPPNFTIEVQCINEYEAYLKALIHEIGVQLHSGATCSSLQCIRHGFFNLEDSLLRKHWTVQHFINNMSSSQRILAGVKHNSPTLISAPHVKQKALLA